MKVNDLAEYGDTPPRQYVRCGDEVADQRKEYLLAYLDRTDVELILSRYAKELYIGMLLDKATGQAQILVPIKDPDKLSKAEIELLMIEEDEVTKFTD